MREAALAHQRVEADVARLRDEVLDAYAAGHEAKAAKVSRERDEARRTTLRDAAERLEGARRAEQRADVERATFAAANVDGLVTELPPDAAAVAEGAEQAVAQLAPAHARWNADQEVSGLLRLADRTTAGLPRFPEQLATLVRDARRASGVNVPPPVPGARQWSRQPAAVHPGDAGQA